jgi:hypothetical protein
MRLFMRSLKRLLIVGLWIIVLLAVNKMINENNRIGEHGADAIEMAAFIAVPVGIGIIFHLIINWVLDTRQPKDES